MSFCFTQEMQDKVLDKTMKHSSLSVLTVCYFYLQLELLEFYCLVHILIMFIQL